jgi:hypothetical protein
MVAYYDDNFGFYEDMGDPDMVDFYHRNQERSVLKACDGCGQEVSLLPHYAYCNGCADIIERGGDLPDRD